MAKDKLSSITYGALKKLLEDSLVGLGVIKGKNCTVQSITDITGGKRVTFAWIDDEGEPHTAPMDVMNGAKGDPGTKGDPGDDYVLTAQDKADIADLVLAELPVAEEIEV